MTHRAADQIAADEGVQLTRESLAQTLNRITAEKGPVAFEAMGLSCWRREAPTELTAYTHEPSLCLVAQGAKRLLLGEELIGYDADHYLVTTVDLPIVAQITQASPEKPYLGLTLRLDQATVSQLLMDSHLPLPRTQKTSRGMAVSKINVWMLEAFQRLLALSETPEDIPILAPLIRKEIIYRLLVGEQGPLLRQMGTVGSQTNQLGQAIDWLKENYSQPLRVDDLAAHARMSISTFHRHFRELTAMSPLQFQKRLRLYAARRIMFTEHTDATSVAFRVGYESSTQFNREYSRLFGAPPLRDIKGLRAKGLSATSGEAAR